MRRASRRCRTPGVLASLALGAWCFAGAANAQGDALGCALPDSVNIADNGTVLELRTDRERFRALLLYGLSAPQRWLWSIGLLLPRLAVTQGAVSLYAPEEARFLLGIEDIERVALVRFFIVCEGEHGYRAIPATVSRTRKSEGESRGRDPSAQTYIGISRFAAGRRRPSVTLYADFAEFRRHRDDTDGL